MLYPKNAGPLTGELFQNPSSEYRGTPFWAWNNKLDPDELTWQIERLKEMGFGGFHMHVRVGLATGYLSDEFMECIAACVDKARSEGMLAWLYDEDCWPSGAAGGLVTQNPRYRERFLRLTREPCGDTGKPAACYDIELSADGTLSGYKRIRSTDKPAGFMLCAYLEQSEPSPWFNGQTYVNTLDPAAIDEFIKVTYERYNARISDDFGSVVPAVFTDEPQFRHKQVLTFAHDDMDITIPWTDDLPETYRTAYGDDILDSLPELIWDLPDGAASRARYRYHDHVAERFAAAFADRCGAWCEKHGIMLTGHMMEEPALESQTAVLGDAMRSYRSFQLPGIDMLCDQREFTTAKQAQSAARQFGRPGVLSELYGVTNWDFDFRGHKLQGDWQAALGVTVRVPHLSWVSMNGEAKRDYPATFNYQSPWYKEYHYIEDHFARVNTAMTRGRAVCRTGVIHPVESYWLHWGPRETTFEARRKLEQQFNDITQWLLRGLIDFDFICESLLPSFSELPYEVIIVPGLETIRSSTLERLEAFKGRVIFAGGTPSYVDAVPDSRNYNRFEHIPFNRHAVLTALRDVRDVNIRRENGDMTDNLLYQLRQEDDGTRWLFIAHADKPSYPDTTQGDILKIQVRGEYDFTLYDTLTGKTHPLDAGHHGGRSVIQHTFYAHDSLLLRLDKCAAGTGRDPVATGKTAVAKAAGDMKPADTSYNGEYKEPDIRFLEAVPVTLHEPNVLLLDAAEYALDSEEYRPGEDILRLDNILRDELGLAPRGGSIVQPWVDYDTSTPHTLRLRYTIRSDINVSGAYLALENAGNTKVTLDGQPAEAPDGWYTDKCIGKVKLPTLHKGENVLELTIPYGKNTDVEACYLLGDFGVSVSGRSCVLTAPVSELHFGDITRQGLPFYGGNITYHMETAPLHEPPETDADALIISAPFYRGHLLRVSVDGKDFGVIAFAPCCVKAEGLKPGKHKIDLKYYGSRINTFGQLHCTDKNHPWWGPDSWRTTGDKWSYEYNLWPQGILKSPEIRV